MVTGCGRKRTIELRPFLLITLELRQTADVTGLPSAAKDLP